MVHNINAWHPSALRYEETLVDEFRSELQKRESNPKAGDRIQKAWAKASLWLLDEFEPYRELVIEQALSRPELPVDVRAELRLKSAFELGMTDGIGYYYNGFPHHHLEPEDWRPDLIRLYDPTLEPEISARARKHVIKDPNSATTPARIAGPMMALAGLRVQDPEKVKDKVAIFDAACSANICLPAYSVWADQGYLPHHSVEIVNPRTKKPDERGNYLFQSYMSNAPRLASGLGADILDMSADENRTYARTSSFYGEDLLNRPEKHDFYLLLESMKLSGVEFMPADLRNLDIDAVLASNDKKKYPMSWFLTAAYQMVQRDIVTILGNLFKISDTVLIQDTLTRHGGAHSGLRRNRRGYEQEYKYRTFLAEQIDGEIVYHELFVWQNGRCERGYFGRDIGRISLSAA